MSYLQPHIKAGESRIFRDFSEVGKLVLVACETHELSGRVSILDEDEIVITDKKVVVPDSVLSEDNTETLLPDTPHPLPVSDQDGEAGNLILTLVFPKQFELKPWFSRPTK